MQDVSLLGGQSLQGGLSLPHATSQLRPGFRLLCLGLLQLLEFGLSFLDGLLQAPQLLQLQNTSNVIRSNLKCLA